MCTTYHSIVVSLNGALHIKYNVGECGRIHWPRLAEVELTPYSEIQLKRTLASFTRHGEAKDRSTPGEGCRFCLLNWRYFVLVDRQQKGWTPNEKAPIWSQLSWNQLVECIALCRSLCPAFEVPAPSQDAGPERTPEPTPRIAVEPAATDAGELEEQPLDQEEENWATIERDLEIPIQAPNPEETAVPAKKAVKGKSKPKGSSPQVRR